MGVIFRNWQERLYMMKPLIIHLVCWLGWFSKISVAQPELGATIIGSVNVPNFVITCIGNLAYFFTCFLRRGLHFDIAVSESVLRTAGGPLTIIDGFESITRNGEFELQCASVIMLSKNLPFERDRRDHRHNTIGEFMRYIYNAHGVRAILLQHFPLKEAAVTTEMCECSEHECGCIVLWTVEQITMMIALRMPGTLKPLSDSLCLLPSLKCLRNGCHGCNQGMLHVEKTDEFGNPERLIEGDPMNVDAESPAAVCETLDIFPKVSTARNFYCICIPVRPAEKDDWTKFLIGFLRSKNKEASPTGGVIVTASDHLQNYMANSRICSAFETYSTLGPSQLEILMYIGLTLGLKVDGFSSSLMARSLTKGYIVNSKGNGYSSSYMVLDEALVKSNAQNTHVCQVLFFNENMTTGVQNVICFSNLICSVAWAVLVAKEGGTCKWYSIPSMPPSKSRVSLIMAAIFIALVMDCIDMFFLSRNISGEQRISGKKKSRLLKVIVLEIICIVSGISIAKSLGMKGFGRWIYSVLYTLVWLKFIIGTYIFPDYLPKDEIVVAGSWIRGLESGILVYSSAFLLNAVLALARSEWRND